MSKRSPTVTCQDFPDQKPYDRLRGDLEHDHTIEGRYRGVDYKVVLYKQSHHNAYVKLPEDNRVYIHGGITGGTDSMIGWDYVHHSDYGLRFVLPQCGDSTFKTFAYAIYDVMRVIDKYFELGAIQ